MDDSLNLTELVLMAQDIDPEAHRGLGRDTLLEIINSGETPGLPQRRINKLRLNIMTWILGNWSQVAPLVTCPARSKDPRSCFQCTDVQVIECKLTNKHIQFDPSSQGDRS